MTTTNKRFTQVTNVSDIYNLLSTKFYYADRFLCCKISHNKKSSKKYFLHIFPPVLFFLICNVTNGELFSNEQHKITWAKLRKMCPIGILQTKQPQIHPGMRNLIPIQHLGLPTILCLFNSPICLWEHYSFSVN